MSDQTDSLAGSLTPFGLSLEEAKVYLFLAQSGIFSALQISREVHMARTKVYRILDKLIAKKLVSVGLDDMGKKFGANSYQGLELLVKEGSRSRKIAAGIATDHGKFGQNLGYGAGEK